MKIEGFAELEDWNGMCGPLESACWTIMAIRTLWWGEIWFEAVRPQHGFPS